MKIIESFEPIIDINSKVLILGSMPGIESLKKQQYYGYPRNHFWTIIFTILGEEFENDYYKKIDILTRRRLALWDVVKSCRREGSLDSNIKNEEVNDIELLLNRFPNIKFIAFNGTKAFNCFNKYIGVQILDEKGILYKKLSSTSPIPGRNIKTIDTKIEEWQIVLNYI